MDIPDKLRVLSTISSDGNFSEVFLCENTYLNNRKEAVKLIKIDWTEEESILSHKVIESLFEASVLEYLGQSDYIVKIYDAQILEKGFRINMEYLENGSLQEYINKSGFLDTKVFFRVIECVLCWLEYAHCKNILHLDIKPWNILIKNNNVYKLSDFGLSWVISHDGSSTFRMIYNNHTPPESIDSNSATIQSDVYMLGITMYRILNWDSHFMSQIDGLSYEEVCEMIKKWRFPSRDSYLPHIHPKLRKIINKCLNVDLSKRYKTVREIRADIWKIKFEYNWIHKSTWENTFKWSCYKDDKLVYEIFCEKLSWWWNLQFYKIWKKHKKVTNCCFSWLSDDWLYSKLDTLFTTYF